jgi:uncharacterized protein involved in outer membrane biogenesis
VDKAFIDVKFTGQNGLNLAACRQTEGCVHMPETLEKTPKSATEKGRQAGKRRGVAFWGGLGLIGVLLVTFGGMGAAVWWVQNNDVRGLAAWGAARAGVPLVFDGPVTVQVWPQPMVQVRQVRLPGADGGPDVFRLAAGEVQATWGDGLLFWRGIALRNVSLTAPVLNVQVDAQGVGNWPHAMRAEAEAAAAAGTSPKATPMDVGGMLARISGAVLNVADLTVDYVNAQNGQTLKIREGTLQADTTGTTANTQLKALVNGAAVNGTLRADVADLEDVPLQLDFVGLGLTVKADGRVVRQQQFSGQVAARTDNVKATLTQLLGKAPAAAPAEAFRLSGDVAAGPERVAVRGFTASLGSLLQARGDAEVQLGDQPSATGDVAASGSNLRQLLALLSGTPQEGVPAVAFAAQAKLAGQDVIDVRDLRVTLADVLSLQGKATVKPQAGGAPEVAGTVQLQADNVSRLAKVMGLQGTFPAEPLRGQVQFAGKDRWNVPGMTLTLGEGDSVLATLQAEGTFVPGPQPELNGKMALSGPQVVRLARGFGLATAGLPSSPFEVRATLQGQNAWELTDLVAQLPGLLEATGGLTWVPGTVPMLRGDLQVGLLNATAFGWCSAAAPTTPVAGGGGKALPKAGAGASPWSDAPIDVRALRTLGVDVRLNVAKVVCGNVPVETARLKVLNTPSRLSVDDLNLGFAQGGTLTGSMQLDHATTPKLELALNGNQLALERFVPVLQTKGVQLPLDLKLELVTQGNSTQQLANGLAGKVMLTGDRGQIPYGQMLGNVAALERALRGVAQPAGNGNGQVDSVRIVLVLREGVASTDTFDVSTNNGLMTLKGTGTVDVGAWAIDYVLTPNVAVDSGLAVPVKVTGSLSAPQIGADPAFVQKLTSRLATEGVKSLLGLDKTEAKGVGAAVGEVLQGNLTGEGVQNLLGGFLGAKQPKAPESVSPSDAASPTGAAAPPANVPDNPLGNLLQQVLPAGQ